MASRSNPLPPCIGRFRVDALLGSGGMGEVYEAFDPTLKRTVAVKTVRPDIDRPEYLERLYREAQACARLTHPNIVTVYEAGEIDGVVYMAMEFLKGEDLAAVLRRGELPFEVQILILIQVLDALEHAHANDVIHRDIKPSNVYRQSDGSVKLVDFGLARVAQTLTVTGPVMGTPDYASPEQLRGLTVDNRSDIYSTGVLAYQMISGRRPFGTDDDSVATIVLRVMSEPPPPMDVSWTRTFPEIERIVSRAMAKSPDERYQSATDMRDALAAFLSSSGDAIRSAQAGDVSSLGTVAVAGPARPPLSGSVTGVQTPRRSRDLWWAGGVAAAILIAAAVILPRGMGQTTESTGVVSAPSPAANQTAGTAVPPVGVPRPVAGAPASQAPTKPAAPSQAAPSTAAATVLSAKQLFFGDGKASGSAGLRYRLIQQSSGGAEADVDPSTEFRSGDGVRFAFESNIDGYLYVAQLGTSGRWTVLFPNPEINGGRNAIKKLEQYLVPNDGWFRFDATPGTEQVFVFLSREPLSQLPGFDRPVTRLESVTAAVVKDLQQNIRPRDLVFQKDRSDTSGAKPTMVNYVVNRDEVGKAVAASIQLKHGQAP